MSNAELYQELKSVFYGIRPYEKEDLGEGMALVNELRNGYWKPRYLMSHETGMAYEFMDSHCRLKTITTDDIAWETIDGFSDTIKERARTLDGYFPTIVHHYHNGMARVRWEINPDGRYYSDGGFGETDDKEITLHGYIDRKGKPLIKFRFIKSSEEHEIMELEAKAELDRRQ